MNTQLHELWYASDFVRRVVDVCLDISAKNTNSFFRVIDLKSLDLKLVVE
jgi:hypothetical protein